MASREQLLDLVTSVQNGDFDDEELSAVLDSLIQSTGDPNISDYVFWPEGEELTAEEIVDKALAHRPIEL